KDCTDENFTNMPNCSFVYIEHRMMMWIHGVKIRISTADDEIISFYNLLIVSEIFTSHHHISSAYMFFSKDLCSDRFYAFRFIRLIENRSALTYIVDSVCSVCCFTCCPCNEV